MLAKYFSIIRNYVLSVSSEGKYIFYHQNTLLDAFRTNSRNIIGRNPSMVIPLLANQDLTPMLAYARLCCLCVKHLCVTCACMLLTRLFFDFLCSLPISLSFIVSSTHYFRTSLHIYSLVFPWFALMFSLKAILLVFSYQ